MEQSNSEFLSNCRNDFLFFVKNVLEFDVIDYHREIGLIPLKHRYSCIMVPTGHSKTTLFSVAYPMWRLWRERGIEICLVSSSLEQSMKMLGISQAMLEANDFFKDILPKNRTDLWNKSQTTTSNGNKFYVKPFNSTARGIHPHYIIYDDLLRDSLLEMNEIRNTFWGIFYPRGQINKCQHVVVGTPMTEEDLYAQLEKRDDWYTVRKQAVIEDDKGNWLRPLWEDRFSLVALEKIRENMGDYYFEREYMCRPKATGDVLYPTEMLLNCLDDDLEYGYTAVGKTYIGSDFAMSTKSSGDYNVFTVVDNAVDAPHIKQIDKGEITIENPVIIKRIIRFRGNVGHMYNLKTLNDQFPASKNNADSSGVGAKFVQEMRENQMQVTAEDFRPASRNLLLMNLRRVIEQGRLVIPNKGMNIPLTQRLILELSSFRKVKTKAGMETWHSSIDHDDMVMCYDDETEILTCNGWKYFDDVSVNDEVWSLNNKGYLEKAKVKNKYRYDYSGDMVRFKSKSVDLLVTPNHNMFVRESKGANQYSDFKFKRADSLLGKHFRLKKNAKWIGLGGGYIAVPAFTNNCNYKKNKLVLDKGDFFEFMGYYISEGSGNGNRIHLAQLRKSKAWLPIKMCLERLGFSYKIQRDGFLVYDKQFCSYVKQLVSGTAFGKIIPKFMLKQSRKNLKRLFDALMLGDGCGHVYVTCSPKLKDDFSELCLKLGLSTTFKKNSFYVGRKALNGVGRFPIYFISINNSQNEPRFNHHSKNQVFLEGYNGIVDCVGLDKNHIVYVRRNNRSVWSGNSLALAVKDVASPRKLMKNMFFGV